MNRPLARVLTPLAILLSLMLAQPLAAQSAAPPTAAADSVTAEEALAAWQRFKRAPLENLKEAPTFLRFMQGGAVHTVLNSNLVFWMYQDYPPEAQAVLYSAYMGGNLESQLVTRKQGDDPEAAMSATLDAYTVLRARNAELTIQRLDDLIVARKEGRFAQAVADLGQGRP